MMSNGQIQLSDLGVVINPDFSEQVFLASPLSAGSADLVHNGEYRSYSVGRHSIGGTLFVVSLFFQSGLIRSVHLSPIDESVSSFGDVTDVSLERQAKENKDWVVHQLGVEPPVSFEWGKIETTCDKKSWDAMIVVSYV